MKDSLVTYQILNAALFGLLFFWYYKRTRKSFNQTTFILIVWFISSITGIFYVLSDSLYIGLGNPTYYCVFLVFGLYLLFLWPLLCLPQRKMENYTFDSSVLLYLLCIIVSLISILPFIENVIHLFNGETFHNMSKFHDEMSVRSTSRHLTWLSVRLTSVLAWFRYITPALFFNYISHGNRYKSKLITAGLVIALVNNSVNSFSVGARNIVIQEMSLLVFMFFFMRYTINTKIRNKIVKYSTVFGSVLLLGIIVITLGRFGSHSGESVGDSIFRYSGEGFNNLYTDMLNTDNHTYGLHIFRSLLGIEPDTLSFLMGIRMHVFYTFIGDFIADFSIEGTIIIFAVFSALIYFTCVRNHHMSFLSLCLLTIYADVLSSGYMYVPYMNYSEGLVSYVIFAVVYFVFSKLATNIPKYA